MTAPVVVQRPIGMRSPECLRLVLPQVEQETTNAVQRARAPEGSEQHREALASRHGCEVAAGSPLPFDLAYKSDQWIESTIENLSDLVEGERLKLIDAEQELQRATLDAAAVPQPRSTRWRRTVACALVVLAAATAFASAQLIGPTIDAFALGGYLATAYGAEAGIASHTFLIALLLSSVATVGQAAAVLICSGRLGAGARMGMVVADLLIAASLFALRASAGSFVQSVGMVMIEVALLLVFTAICLGASTVLRADADRRDGWVGVASRLAVLQEQVERVRRRHGEYSEMVGQHVEAYAERETGHRHATRMAAMVDATVNEAYLTAQAELVAGLLESEAA